ncbi:DUF5994 family protein [Parasphingorhabdus pacifica]
MCDTLRIVGAFVEFHVVGVDASKVYCAPDGRTRAVLDNGTACSRVARQTSDMWAAVPRKMFIEGRTVHFEGFRSMDPNTVAVTSSIAGRLSLLVVPLDASEEAARAAMAAAVSNDFARGGGEMARSTMPLGVPSFGFELVVSPRSADPVSEERWETEGGQVRVPA